MPLPDELIEQIPEEYRDNETLKRFNTFGDLAKSYVEARGALGNSIRIPGKDAGEDDRQKFLDSLQTNAPELMLKPNFDEQEQRDEFFRTLGWPEKPEDYKVPDELSLDENTLNGMRQVLHEARLTPSQTNKVLAALDSSNKEMAQVTQEQREKSTKELKQEWGMTFDERVNAAKRVQEETGLYPGKDFGDLTPKEIKSLYEIHSAMTGKGPQASTQDQQLTQHDTPGEAKQKYAEMMRRAHDRNNDLTNQERKEMVERAMDVLVKAGVARKSIDELRA